MSLEENSSLIQTNWESPPIDPMDLMKDWVGQAKEVGVSEPLGMTLNTVNKASQPRDRVVLVKLKRLNPFFYFVFSPDSVLPIRIRFD